MAIDTDVTTADGRALRVHDSGSGPEPVVFWFHGSPQTGELLEPLLTAALRRGLRLVSYDRPGYGGSTPNPGRDVASGAADVAAIADALGIDRFATMGASGGGPHAFACGALLTDRVAGVVSLAGLAPFNAEGLDWFGGMAPAGAAELSAATKGRAGLETYLASAEFDMDVFTPADQAALTGPWSSLGANAGAAMSGGLGGLVDDDLAFVSEWGCDPALVAAPVLVLHGTEDRFVPSSHGEWLARRSRSAELRLCPGDGHVSVLNHCAEAMDWLADRY